MRNLKSIKEKIEKNNYLLVNLNEKEHKDIFELMYDALYELDANSSVYSSQTNYYVLPIVRRSYHINNNSKFDIIDLLRVFDKEVRLMPSAEYKTEHSFMIQILKNYFECQKKN